MTGPDHGRGISLGSESGSRCNVVLWGRLVRREAFSHAVMARGLVGPRNLDRIVETSPAVGGPGSREVVASMFVPCMLSLSLLASD